MTQNMSKVKVISRENQNGNCINNERHSWKIEYGTPTTDRLYVYSVDTHTCIKCGEVKHSSHKGLLAK